MANFTSLIVNVQWKYTQLNATYCHDNATLDATLVNTCYVLPGLEMSTLMPRSRIHARTAHRTGTKYEIATQNATQNEHIYTH